MLTGLFLGAGASYELGLPLAWDLTAELKAWLRPGKLREFNRSWNRQGGSIPDEIIDEIDAILHRPDMHYESVLGYLQTQYKRHLPHQDSYSYVYTWLVQMIYHMLYYRQVKNEQYIKTGVRYYEGLIELAKENKPLWIFSLNHDVMIECIAAAYGLAINAGFSAERIDLPRRNTRGDHLGIIKAEVLRENHLKSGSTFFNSAEGINLFKIHGGLDIFMFSNGKDMLRIIPQVATIDGVLGSLKAANEELIFPDLPVRPLNEIAYADSTGEMQFLRRSLLAGAFKFDSHTNQVLPIDLLKYFENYLNHLNSLLCIGYSFGDYHINHIIRKWLEFSGSRRLEIIGPGTRAIPSLFLHLAPQVTLVDSTATQYLDRFSKNPLSRSERIGKSLREKARVLQGRYKGFR